MRTVLAAVMVAALCALVALPHAHAQKTEIEYQLLFMGWLSKHGKTYVNAENFDGAFETFKRNFDMIERHNGNLDRTYDLECNQFCDWTWEKFKAHFNLDRTEAPQHCSATAKETRGKPFAKVSKDLPKRIDWRDKHVVTPVKNQGSCGSCWAFSSTGCMESWWALKTGNLTGLSEQQLLDCTKNFDNHGCKGGLPSHSFEGVNYIGGIMSEKDYPYRGVESGVCKFDPKKVVAKFGGSNNITEGDENGIYQTVGSSGPVSIAYQVVSDFMFYRSGIYSSTRCKSGPMDVNHAVLAVGYDENASGEPYWIIKNSWGSSWGISGYFWMARNKNMCGIATCASYPQV